MVSVIHPSSTQQTLRNLSYYSYSNTDNQNYGSQSSDYINYGSWSNWSQCQLTNSSYSRPVHQSFYPAHQISNCVSSLPYTTSNNDNNNNNNNNNKSMSVRKSYNLQRSISKDYTKPLFVDCSIEYELPNAPKIPRNSEPILMIHPSYYKIRKGMETTSSSSSTLPTSIHSDEVQSLRNRNYGISKGLKRGYCQMSNESYGYNQHNLDPWLQSYPPITEQQNSINCSTYSNYEPIQAKKISLSRPM